MPKAWHRPAATHRSVLTSATASPEQTAMLTEPATKPTIASPGSPQRARAQWGHAQQHTMDENSLSARRQRREEQQQQQIQRAEARGRKKAIDAFSPSPRERVLSPPNSKQRRINHPRIYIHATDAPTNLAAYREQLRQTMQLEVSKKTNFSSFLFLFLPTFVVTLYNVIFTPYLMQHRS